MSVEPPRAYVEELLAASGLPGLALAVTDRKGLVASEAFGLASVEAEAPVTRGTLFEIGSIGKTFTAILVLQLHEQGALDLDAPVTHYLPWFEVRSAHGPIAIRHLLAHTSGLMVGAELSASSRFDVWALREAEVGFAPGSRYLYSNIGFRALGFVVEELTGRPYAAALRERILEPLGLDATEPEVTHAVRQRLAVGHQRLYDDRPGARHDPWVPATWLETGTGDGSPAATMEDLSRFLRALLNRGDGLLGGEAFGLMAAPAIEADDGWSYGCGLEVRERDGRTEIRHGGSMPGFGATMLGDLDAGLGVTVAVNGIDEADVSEVVAEAILGLYRDGARPSVVDPLAVEDAGDFAGIYIGEAGRLVVTAEGDRLLLGGAPMEPRGGERFFGGRPDLALFLLGFRREDGAVVEAVHGGDVYRREGLAATSAPATPPGWSAYVGHYRSYNPWYSNFRVVLRGTELVLVWAWGFELPLTELDQGWFRVDDEWSPERLRFDAIADGRALRATLAGEAYYRLPG